MFFAATEAQSCNIVYRLKINGTSVRRLLQGERDTVNTPSPKEHEVGNLNNLPHEIVLAKKWSQHLNSHGDWAAVFSAATSSRSPAAAYQLEKIVCPELFFER